MAIDIESMLAAKHTGMLIDAEGLLISNRRGKLDKYLREQMLGHLKDMAERFYAGDVSVVDEFLQLYCLDDKRPSQP